MNYVEKFILAAITFYALCIPFSLEAQILEINCPENVVLDAANFINIPEGLTRDDLIKGWYDDWLGQFFFQDNGCNPSESGLDGHSIPTASFGGLISITYVVTDECNNEETCSSTFEVVGTIMDPIIVSCPSAVVMPAGSGQSQIDSAFSIWIASFTAIPANALQTDLSGIISPRPGDPIVEVTFLAEDPNNADNTGTCFSSFAPPTATIIDMNDEIPTMGEWGILSLFLILMILGVRTVSTTYQQWHSFTEV